MFLDTRSARGHAPDPFSHVVGDQQSAISRDRDADRTPAGVALRVEETGEHILGRAGSSGSAPI
jgi:hypothetical protein